MAGLALDAKGVLLSCAGCAQKNRVAFERLGESGQCGKCGQGLPAVSAPVEVKSAAQFEALVRGSRISVLIDFWAAWCGPCRMVAPELAKVAESGRGELVVAKVNTEELPELARRFNVAGIPLLVLFRGGREVSRLAGARPAAAIESFVRQAV